jgi:hypothetical protein
VTAELIVTCCQPARVVIPRVHKLKHQMLMERLVLANNRAGRFEPGARHPSSAFEQPPAVLYTDSSTALHCTVQLQPRPDVLLILLPAVRLAHHGA